MQWADEGLIIGTRRHGETSLILEVMTRGHGRRLGLVKGGRGRRHAAMLQPGNSVTLAWFGRIDEQLGQFAVEPLRQRAASLIDSAAALNGLGLMAALLRLLPERETHPGLHEAAEVVVDHLDAPGIAAALIARFELRLLAELGFGLDLSRCAATGGVAELAFVSPKSGRAVSRQAGAPYADRLFRLPAFLHSGGGNAEPQPDDIVDAFRISGFFLSRHVFEPRGVGVPDQRAQFIGLALQSGQAAARSLTALSRAASQVTAK
jgi:DNA repair protein RecO (recombination protein O)